MSTRSTISIVDKKGTGRTNYCHWDGYLAHNGKILLTHYKTTKKVNQLIGLGDLSILNENIGKKVKFDGFDSGKTPQCLAYGRDRGEGVTFRLFSGKPTEEQEYDYLFENRKWYVRFGDTKNWRLLTKELIKANKD